MIKSFVQVKHRNFVISAMIIVTILAVLLLWIDEVYALGSNKQYIFFTALLALTATFMILIFRTYILYQNIKKFLPMLGTANIISDTTQYLISTNQGMVLLFNDQNIINFCNNRLVSLLSHNTIQSYPVEFSVDNRTVKLYKLKDLCKHEHKLSNYILITVAPNDISIK